MNDTFKIKPGDIPIVEKFYSDTIKKNLFELNYRAKDEKLFSCIEKTEKKCHEKLNDWRASRLKIKPGESFEKKLTNVLKIIIKETENSKNQDKIISEIIS